MAQACSRCGRVSEVEYGTDGLAYCSSCVFYGTNKQCFRCMMYLPAAELQQYKGVWACPYCIRDMRDDDRKKGEGTAPEKPHMTALASPEICERCGRNLDERIYIWNGRRLCKKCLDDEQGTWGVVGGPPSHGGARVSFVPIRKARQRSLFEALIGDLLAMLGIRRKEPEVVLVEPRPLIGQAKPLAEKRMREGGAGPQSEGIMTPKQKRGGGGRPGSAAKGGSADANKKS